MFIKSIKYTLLFVACSFIPLSGLAADSSNTLKDEQYKIITNDLALERVKMYVSGNKKMYVEGIEFLGSKKYKDDVLTNTYRLSLRGGYKGLVSLVRNMEEDIFFVSGLKYFAKKNKHTSDQAVIEFFFLSKDGYIEPPKEENNRGRRRR